MKRVKTLIYFALTGLCLGIAVSLLLAQWTWLELRFNTGLAIPAGCLIGIVIGLLPIRKPNPLWGWVSVLVLVVTALGVSKGNLDNVKLVVGAVVREGIHWDSLSMQVADLLVIGLLIVTIGYSFLLKAFFNKGLGNCSCKSEQGSVSKSD